MRDYYGVKLGVFFYFSLDPSERAVCAPGVLKVGVLYLNHYSHHK